MRETENELNLLLPGGGNFVDQGTHSGPDWRFAPADDSTNVAAAPVDADEYGGAAGGAAGKGRR
jgi:hypothetical protein